MPPSRSPSRTPDRPEPIRLRRPLILIGVLAVVGFALIALPASLLGRFLPPQVRAEDFSGTLWHGSAGKLTVLARDAGACEWHVHPLSLLTLTLDADVHWVKNSAVIDAALNIDRHGYRARNVHGTASLEDLRELDLAPGWQGTMNLQLSPIEGDFQRLKSIAGNVDLNALSSASLAAGAPLGNYRIQLASDALSADGAIAADITDQGGPLELQAQAHYTPANHTGLLTGTLKERPEAAAGLREQVGTLTQLRPRDAQGRIPVELEFTL